MGWGHGGKDRAWDPAEQRSRCSLWIHAHVTLTCTHTKMLRAAVPAAGTHARVYPCGRLAGLPIATPRRCSAGWLYLAAHPASPCPASPAQGCRRSSLSRFYYYYYYFFFYFSFLFLGVRELEFLPLDPGRVETSQYTYIQFFPGSWDGEKYLALIFSELAPFPILCP